MELQLLRHNASAFKKSAERNLEQRPLTNGKIEFFIVPAIVNLAFSVELYLKFLLGNNKTPIKKHELLDLFNMLDPSMKQDIIKLTRYDISEFELLLKEHSTAFVEWRYLHESNTCKRVNLEFIIELANSIESIVNRTLS